MNIEGAGAIVTGGASGLGAATARALGSAGAIVTIFDLQDELGDAVADEIGGSYRRTDVTSADEVASGVGAIDALRVVVNCAGIGGAARIVSREGRPADVDAFHRVIEGNLVGTFNVLTHAAAAMAGNGPDDEAIRKALTLPTTG